LARQRTPIPMGEGLDRESGLLVTRPTSIVDLRNIVHRNGKVMARPGMADVITITDTNGVAVTDILGGVLIKGDRTNIIVAYQGDSGAADYGKVLVYQADEAALAAFYVGTWFTSGTPATVPQISLAEVYGKVFMAHTERSISARATTYVFDSLGSSELYPLQADLTDDGVVADIKFRGVVRHLDYLAGWGFGDRLEDRPELLRTSRPALPDDFLPDDYAIVGNRRDPIVQAIPAVNGLVCGKETEVFTMVGDNARNFGVFPVDTDYGMAGPRLGVAHGGRAWYWSSTGPRSSDGAPLSGSQDLGLALALDEVEPADLPALGTIDEGWAGYIPEERCLLWCFGQRCYVLALHDPQNPRWSYWTLGVTPRSGFQLLATGTTTAAPTGYPDFDYVDEAESQLTVHWQNEGPDGDETVELWLRTLVNLLEDNWRMSVDAGSGIVEDWSSGGAATFTPSVASSAQKIAVTASASAGDEGYVERVYDGIVAGQTIVCSLQTWFEALGGTCEGRLQLDFLDASDTVLGSAAVTTNLTNTSKQRHYVQGTAPSTATKFRIRAIVHAVTAGDTGTGYFNLSVAADTASMGGWDRADTQPVGVGAQSDILDGLNAGTLYEIALRYRRGVTYTSGYETADPTNWPDVSKGVGHTTVAAPTIASIVWKRTSGSSEQIDVHFSIATPSVDHEILVDGVVKATVTTAEIAGASASFASVATPDLNPETYQDIVVRAAASALSYVDSATVTRWIGPAKPDILNFIALSTGGSFYWTVAYDAANLDESYGYGTGTWNMELYEDQDDPTLATTPVDTVDASLGESPYAFGSPPIASSTVVQGRIRVKKTTYGVDDFSTFSDTLDSTVP